MFTRTNYQTLNQIEVSRTALTHNFHFAQQRNPNTAIAPVLKSNAYGHDLTLVAKFIDRNLDAPFIIVDSLYEAYELHKSRIKTPILIIGYTAPENFKIRKNLTHFRFPVYDKETIQVLNHHQPGAKVHLKVDTGMNRLGIQPHQTSDFIQLFKQYDRIELEGIYSHFSQSDNPKNKGFTAKQVKTFNNVIEQFEAAGFNIKWKHIAASAASLNPSSYQGEGMGGVKQGRGVNLIRLGLGFYGLSPYKEGTKINQTTANNLKPALSLKTRLAQIKQIGEGSEVSYSGTFVAKKPMTIGILPIGYYDGVDRRLSNQGIVKVGGGECPIIGNVCMNLTIIDLSNVKNPQVGDPAVVYSDHPKDKNSIQKSATLCDTIPYTLLVNLSETTKRILVE